MVRGKYLNSNGEKIQKSWNVHASVEEKWDILKSALCDGAEAVIGYEDRRNQTGLGRVRLLLHLF